MTSPAKVNAALQTAAAKLDRVNRGVHIFGPIFPMELPGCNWSSSFQTRGSSLPLDDMRAALERVQAKYPVVEF
jgi:hypothetical protein